MLSNFNQTYSVSRKKKINSFGTICFSHRISSNFLCTLVFRVVTAFIIITYTFHACNGIVYTIPHPVLSLIPSISLPDVLCDPTDLIWRKGTPFEATTGRTALHQRVS